MLYAMHRFMGWTIKLTDQSLERAICSLRTPGFRAYQTRLISRLLNSQLKSAMLVLIREVTREVLEKLERELFTRNDSVWAICFFVISILCMCMEDAQIAMDGFFMHSKYHGTTVSSPSYGERIEACRKLDDHLFTHLNKLFHGVFKSDKKLSTRRKVHVYNPIRELPEDCSTLDQNLINLIKSIRQLISDEGKYASIQFGFWLIGRSCLLNGIGRDTITR